MSNAPGAVAKAFLDALPSLDYNKLVTEARRNFGIVLIGDAEQADDLLRLLRAGGDVPADIKVAVWRFTPGTSAPIALGKTELAIIVPATEEHLKQARESFAGVSMLPIMLDGHTTPDGTAHTVKLSSMDEGQVRSVLVPVLVDRLWERRLALGRSLPATRDRIAQNLIQRSVRDVKVLLGSVAGAGSGRSGAPTPATAQLLMHQASLIVSMAAVYGMSLDDRRAVFTKVAPNLAPTLLLDGVEATLSKLATSVGKDTKYGKLYGPITAYVTRPTLTATSTLVAGLTARRVFRGAKDAESAIARAAARTRDLGKRVVTGAGQSAAFAVGALGTRLRRSEGEPDAVGGEGETSAHDVAHTAPDITVQETDQSTDQA